jgi:curved DNA-binding protein
VKFIDYYKVLGVDESADTADIKKAYRRLARKYHPDVSKEAGAEEKFKRLNEANEALKDPQRRAEYDELKRYGGTGGEFRPPPGWQPRGGARGASRGGPQADEFSDFFSSIFGGAGGHGGGQGGFGFNPGDSHGRAQAPKPSVLQIEVDLDDSFHGAQRRLSLRDPGTGSSRSLDVKIPQGVTDGQKIRLKGQGSNGADLLLEITLKPHRFYKRDGKNLSLTLPVAPWEVALGGEVAVPTMDGVVNLKIPAGSKAGRKMRLKGKGLPGSPPGDQIVELQITLPEQFNEESLELMQKLRDSMEFNPRAGIGV